MVRRKEWCIKMANIRENKRNGKIISFRFTACLERDAEGKQVRPHTVLEDFPLFCPKCRYTCVIRFRDGKIEEMKLPDA